MTTLVLGGQEVQVPFPATLARLGTLPSAPRRNLEVCQIILHHDAALSADACWKALNAKGLSTHFCVDNDGTVWQFLDPVSQVAWHAMGHISDGGPIRQASFNWRSIGIDISNAVLPTFASKYKPPRQQATLTIHGKPVTGLLPYPHQVEVVLKLIQVLREHFPAVPLVTRTETRWVGDLRPDTPGIWGHLHINRHKIDPFGFPFERITAATVAKEESSP